MKSKIALFIFVNFLIYTASCSDNKTNEVTPNPIANTEWISETGNYSLQFSEKLVAYKMYNDKILNILSYTYDDKKIIARGIENGSTTPFAFTAAVVTAAYGNKEHLWIRESNNSIIISVGEKFYKK